MKLWIFSSVVFMSVFEHMRPHFGSHIFFKKPAPVKMPALTHPHDMPLTLDPDHLPLDFKYYQYVGPGIASYKYKKKSMRGLCAEMVLNNSDSGGASSHLSMTVSLRDLVAGVHPQAAHIKNKLYDFYETKVAHGRPASYHAMKAAAALPRMGVSALR